MVRRASKDDLTILNEMINKLYKYETSFNSNSNFDFKFDNYFNEYKIDSDTDIILVYECDGLITGYIHASKKFDKQAFDVEYIVRTIFVDEQYRNNGIGSKLMNNVISILKNRGIKYLDVECYSDNIKSLKFYEKYGFKSLIEIKRKEL